MLAKVHSSILHIHGLVGEKEAQRWLSDTKKETVSASLKVKTPSKKPATRKKTAAATAATDESILNADEGSEGAERDILKETLKLQYTHLIEMDELIREKLFILQVRTKNVLGFFAKRESRKN